MLGLWLWLRLRLGYDNESNATGASVDNLINKEQAKKNDGHKVFDCQMLL